MKKFVPIILAVAMILAMSITAFAADTTTLTITGEDGREYAGYQLLGLTTSLKAGDHADCYGENHNKDCYNYAYTVNEKYAEILQNETFSYAEDTLWGDEGEPASAADVTDDQILDYLAVQTGDTLDAYMSMREVADRLYLAIKEEGIAPDATDLTGNNDVIAQGYWMFADVTVLDGNEANSLVMVNTAGQTSITINPKTALPTVEKKVKDIADGEDDDITDNLWQDSADHDIGDTVPFKLTATLPANVSYYQEYTIVFHDAMAAGLTFDATSVKVYMYDSKQNADADTALSDYVIDVTDNFVVTTEDLADTCTFEVSCDNVLAIDGVNKNTAFVVYYEATLNEAAVVGAVGNPNEVFLEFSNNPYEEGTGETEKDKVIVFTYELVINKTDAADDPLKGAGFTLYKKDATGTYNAIGAELKGADMTTFTWTGLDDGDYKLVESTVPAGYNKMVDIEFAITAEHSELAEEPTLISLDGGVLGIGDVTNGVITEDIVNNTGTVLPETGARGTMLLIGGGAFLVILAAVFMITRKKMSVYAD